MNGRFVISTAGHDAGKVYVVIKEDAGVLWLADGVERKLKNPKKKNRKHVSLLQQENTKVLLPLILQRSRGCDEAIRQAIHHLIKDNPIYK